MTISFNLELNVTCCLPLLWPMYSPVCVVWNYRIRYYWPGTTSLKASLVPLQECDQVPGRAGVTLGRMSIQITKHTEVSLSWSCCPPGPSRPGPCVVPRWVPGGGGGFCHGCPGSTQTREPQAGRSPSRTHAHRAEGKKTRGGRQSLGQFVPWLGAGLLFHVTTRAQEEEAFLGPHP